MASSPSIKVYGIARSPNVQRVLAALVEKNLEFEIVPVNLLHGDNRNPEFLALQPFGSIPVIQDQLVTVFESRAIIRYIAEKYKEQGSALYGSTLEEKALVEQWLEVESQNYNTAAQPIFFNVVVAPMKGMTPDHAVVEASALKLEKVLDVYEEHLGKHKYLAGDFFSLADLSHLPFTHGLLNYTDKRELFARRKNVSAWVERISSRPEWKKVLALN